MSTYRSGEDCGIRKNTVIHSTAPEIIGIDGPNNRTPIYYLGVEVSPGKHIQGDESRDRGTMSPWYTLV